MKRTRLAAIVIGLLLAGGALGLALERGPVGVALRYHLIYRAPTSQKVVALTYDDGPSPVFTRQILKILAKYHVKATFFMIGSQMAKYPRSSKPWRTPDT